MPQTPQITLPGLPGIPSVVINPRERTVSPGGDIQAGLPDRPGGAVPARPSGAPVWSPSDPLAIGPAIDRIAEEVTRPLLEWGRDAIVTVLLGVALIVLLYVFVSGASPVEAVSSLGRRVEK